MGATNELGEFASQATFEAIPPEVSERAKLHILDGLGCAIFGAGLEHSRQVNGLLEEFGGRGDCVVIGSPERTSPYFAAMANGTSMDALEMNDVGVYCHHSSTQLPAILACAERAGDVSGKDLITAICVSYETTVRVGDCAGFEVQAEVGWHTPGFHGTIGAAVGASRVLRASAAQAANAIGIAGDLAGGGLMAARNAAAPTKRLHCGRAAATGVLSALLSQRGYRGVDDVIEVEPWGYLWALTGYHGTGKKLWDLGMVSDQLGTEWTFPKKVGFKYYPAIGMSQTVLDNVARLRQRLGARVSEIDRIQVGLARFHAESQVRREIDDITSANFSPSFAAIVGLLNEVPPLYDSPIAAQLWVTGFKDADVQSLLARTTEVVDEEITRHNPYSVDTTVEVVLRDGSSVKEGTRYEFEVQSMGTRKFRPVSPEQIQAKFMHLATPTIGEERAAKIRELVVQLDALANVRELTAALA